jgi:DNA mismatch repair protein MutL
VGQISILSGELASQIAAGEVVERPANALKELLENALDAHATRCGIEIEGGGLTRIAVIDDGTGMSEEDARLCVERHATSKLRSLADLERLRSYGFRGEALPSIASVSRFKLRTRTRESDIGLELSLEGGAGLKTQPVGCPVGTSVEITDLFFNVPARRKFLRSVGTESAHLLEAAESLALARPELAVTFKRDGRSVRQWLRSADREERVRATLDDELARLRGERGPLGVEAFLTRPERATAGAQALRLLVNCRPIKDRALSLAVAQAYGSVLERGRYPRGVVYLELPPELVDFNVHPQKTELRFADPRAVADALYQILATQLSQSFSLPTPSRWQRPSSGLSAPGRLAPSAPLFVSDRPSVTLRASEPPPAAPAPSDSAPGSRLFEPPLEASSPPFEPPPPAQHTLAERDARPLPSHTPVPSTMRASLAPPPPPDSSSVEALFARESAARRADSAGGAREGVAWASLEFVAQVHMTYLICEGASGLYLLDQHAAAERVTFDRLRREYRSQSVASQALLFPVPIEITHEQAEFIESNGRELVALGLELSLRGETSVSIHTVPRLLLRASPERLLRDLLAETMRDGGRGFSAAVELALATLACHGSLRAGDAVAPAEARALLVALDEADFAGHCPHGRPIVSFTAWSELERKVGRR